MNERQLGREITETIQDKSRQIQTNPDESRQIQTIQDKLWQNLTISIVQVLIVEEPSSEPKETKPANLVRIISIYSNTSCIHMIIIIFLSGDAQDSCQ